jgi:feruloyl esterase
MFDALVNWVEKGQAPETITASKALPDGKNRTRPLCPYPTVATYKGQGSTDDAANFQCVVPKVTAR